MISIAITSEQTLHPVDKVRMRRAVREVLECEGMREVTLSVAIVDDATIRRVNRQCLKHDRPTDVLSFALDETLTTLDGEVIASAETAARMAPRYGWTIDDELLLYVIHGTLHLMGYEDKKAGDRAIMRQNERYYLGLFGLTPRYDDQPKSRRSRAASKE